MSNQSITSQIDLSDENGHGSIGRGDLVPLAGILFLFLLVCLLFLDPVVGLFADDAWYALLAKSIASGQGYQVINSPTPGILPLYPPFYPLLLSIVFRFAPDFPQNVAALKSVSILAMVGLGVATFFYFRSCRLVPIRLTLILTALTLLCQPLLFIATSSLMSECVFAFEMMLMFLLTDRLIRRRGNRRRQGDAESTGGGGGTELVATVLLALLAPTVLLTRSIGFVLVGAVLITLVKERLFRESLLTAGILALVMGLWTFYSSPRVPTPEQRLEQGGNIVMNYRESFWQNVAGVGADVPDTWSDLPGRVAGNLRTILDTGMLYVCAPPLPKLFNYFGRASSFPFALLQLLISLSLVACLIIGYVSAVRAGVTVAEIGLPLLLGLIVLWPFRPLRFLAPMAPFIFFYLITGIGSVLRFVRERRTSEKTGDLTVIVAAAFLVISLFGHGWTIYDRQEKDLLGFTWEVAFEDTEKMMDWVSKNIPQSEVIISNNPALLTLFTGHKSVNLDLTPERWEYFRRANLRYAVLHRYEGNDFWLPGSNSVLYRVGNQADFKVVDLGLPEKRASYIR